MLEITTVPTALTDKFGRLVVIDESSEITTSMIGYKMFDGIEYSSEGIITIEEVLVNANPVAFGSNVNVTEDTELEITLVSTDLEGDEIITFITEMPQHGQLFHSIRTSECFPLDPEQFPQ